MAWYSTGTVAVTSGSKNLVFTGAALVSENAALAGMGIQIEGDDRTYEMEAVGSDSTATLSVNWPGSTASGLTFKIVPIQGFQVAVAKTVAAAALLIAAWTALPAAATTGDYVQFVGVDKVPTARTAVQVATDLSNKWAEVTVASATNCNIGAAACPQVEISGTTTIASLNPSSGTMYPNAIRYVRFSGALTLTHGSTLVLPGNANITTADGDWAIFKSDGSATPVWRCVSYQRKGSVPYTTASPTFTGTVTAAAANFTGDVTIGAGSAATGRLYVYGASSGAVVARFRAFDSSATPLAIYERSDAAVSGQIYLNDAIGLKTTTNHPLLFGTNNTERGRFGSDGSFLVGTTTNGGWQGTAMAEFSGGNGKNALSAYSTSTTSDGAFTSRVDHTGTYLAAFFYSTGLIGSITTNSTTTAYNTSSDERLKTVLVEQRNWREAIGNLWVGEFEKYADFAKSGVGERQFGVLAQQAHAALGGLGITVPANDNGIWMASAEPFAFLALWGVKDLYSIAKSHEAQITSLVAQVASLEARISELEGLRAA